MTKRHSLHNDAALDFSGNDMMSNTLYCKSRLKTDVRPRRNSGSRSQTTIIAVPSEHTFMLPLDHYVSYYRQHVRQISHALTGTAVLNYIRIVDVCVSCLITVIKYQQSTRLSLTHYCKQLATPAAAMHKASSPEIPIVSLQ